MIFLIHNVVANHSLINFVDSWTSINIIMYCPISSSCSEMIQNMFEVLVIGNKHNKGRRGKAKIRQWRILMSKTFGIQVGNICEKITYFNQ